MTNQVFSISGQIYRPPPAFQRHHSSASYAFYVYSVTNFMSFKHTFSGRLVISLSCIVDTEQTEGTEMLQILLS